MSRTHLYACALVAVSVAAGCSSLLDPDGLRPGAIDAGSNIPPECEDTCGDVDQSGELAVGDVAALESLIADPDSAQTCPLAAGDIDVSGELDGRDLELLSRLLAGTLVGGCRACDGVCGDPTRDGEVNSADSLRALRIADGTYKDASVCDYVLADVDRNGVLDQRDANLMGALFLGIATGGCEPCSLGCGDPNGDGTVSVGDAVFINAAGNGDILPTACQFVASDLDGNGVLNVRDSDLVTGLVFEIADPICGVCTGVCGDSNQSGAVDAGDVARVDQFRMGEARPTVCELASADVSGDSLITQRDVGLTSGLSVGTRTGGCQRCTRVCGDANQDGMLTVADVSAAQAIRDGTGVPIQVCQADAADVDGTGSVGDDDIAAIQNAVTNDTVLACVQ